MNRLAADMGAYLASYLAPMEQLLERFEVTDIYLNRPGELWAETRDGALERHAVAEYDEVVLWRLARQVAALAHQGISREHPLLSATLPGGERIQIIAPPATRGSVAFAVRKHQAGGLSLRDYQAAGAFDRVTTSPDEDRRGEDRKLAALLAAGRTGEMLAEAVRLRRNILVSGGTSTGKTTFLNALLAEIPANERLILIEDTPELAIPHDNSVGLVAVRSELGEAHVTADALVSASLRMRPDRIILGELRGSEAFAFLRAINTGHPGSMTTVHADGCRSAVEQIVLLVLQGDSGLARDDVRFYVQSTIDIYVHLERTGGRRRVAEVVMARTD